MPLFNSKEPSTNTNIVWSDFTTGKVWKACKHDKIKEFQADLYAVGTCDVAIKAGFVRASVIECDNVFEFCAARQLELCVIQMLSCKVRTVIMMDDGGIMTLEEWRRGLCEGAVDTAVGDLVALKLICSFATLKDSDWHHFPDARDIVLDTDFTGNVVAVSFCDFGTLQRDFAKRDHRLNTLISKSRTHDMYTVYTVMMWAAYYPINELPAVWHHTFIRQVSLDILSASSNDLVRAFLFERDLSNMT